MNTLYVSTRKLALVRAIAGTSDESITIMVMPDGRTGLRIVAPSAFRGGGERKPLAPQTRAPTNHEQTRTHNDHTLTPNAHKHQVKRRLPKRPVRETQLMSVAGGSRAIKRTW